MDDNNDFGNFKNATISGMKFKDADAGGDKGDADAEPGLGGWEIHLFGTDGAGPRRCTTTRPPPTTAPTRSRALTPGSYTLCETTLDFLVQP